MPCSKIGRQVQNSQDQMGVAMASVVAAVVGLGVGGFVGYVVGWWAGWRNGIEENSIEITDDKINTFLDREEDW